VAANAWKNQMSNQIKTQYVIFAGEGTGIHNVKPYTGKLTARAVRARLTRERAGGDRQAKIAELIVSEYGETYREVDPALFG